jgi:hypothetical protein
MPIFEFKGPDGKTHSIEGPEGATQEQAFQMLQKQLGGPSAPAAPQESLGSDVAKSAASGLAQGTATAVGFPGDMATLAHAIAPQAVVDRVKAIPGAKFIYDHLPTSQAILDDASKNDRSLVDPNYQAQSAPGRYTQAVAKNAGPGLATGMGIPATVASAVAGQGAYDLTGSHLAEGVASIGAGIGVPLAMALRARRAIQPLKDAATVKAEANAGYADPLLRDTTIAPQAVQNVAGDMQAAMNGSRSRFAPAQAPQVHEAIDTLAAANAPRAAGGPPPLPVSIEDLHSFRKTLGTLGRETRDFKPTEQATAAGAAKRVLDQYLDNIPSADVTRGNPIDAVRSLREANANWGAASNAKKVEDLIGNAITDNNAANSAMNLGNRIRQTFKPLLKNDAAKLRGMGYGDDVIDAVSQVNKGDTLTNVLRHGSNMLGGGGGIASTVIGHGISSGAGGAAGYQEGGLPGLVAGTMLGALPGQALRMAANARTLKAAQKVQEQLLSKAPANARIVAANRAAKAANKAAIDRAITQGGLPAAAMMVSRINGG